MNVDFGTISEGELQSLASAIRVATIEEDRGVGVVLRCVNGARTWDLGSDDMWMRITGDAQNFDGVYHLPARIILGAAEFSENSGGCNLVVRDRIVVATATNGTSLELALGTKEPVVRTSPPIGTVTVTVGLRDLQRMLSVATEMPLDVDDMMSLYSKPPTGHVEVSKGKLTLRRSWSYVNCPDTIVTVPAKTTGTGTFYCKYYALTNFLSRQIIGGDPDVTIAFDPLDGRFLSASFDNATIYVERHPQGAATFYPQIIHWLKENDYQFVEDVPSSTIAVKHENVAVRLQLLDGAEEILRSTVTVLHGVKETAKLLRELNRLNTTRAGIRIWHDNNMIVVGRDDRCEGSSNLKPILDSLTREARDLGGLLGPMFGGTQPAKAA